MLINIRRDIMEGRNKTEEFKFRLWNALNHSPNNKELISYNRSQIWNANVCGTTLLSVYGDMGWFVVPDFIKKINQNAFWNATGLDDVTIPKSVEFIGDNIFIDNNSITLHAPCDSCGARYAVLNNVLLDTMGRVMKYDIDSDIKKLDSLKSDILAIRDNGTEQIKSHYTAIEKQMSSTPLYTRFLIALIILGYIEFFVYIILAQKISILLYLAINIPFLFIFLGSRKKKQLKNILKTYKNHDIAYWGAMFSKNFSKKYNGTPLSRYWNLDKSKIQDEIANLESTHEALKPLDAKRYINIKQYSEISIRTNPQNLTLPDLETDKNIQQVLDGFVTQPKNYQVKLDESQTFDKAKAVLINKFVGTTVLKSNGYYSFIDKEELASQIGLDEQTINSMFSNKIELNHDVIRAIYAGYTLVKRCATRSEAELMAAQMNFILGDGASIYKNNKALYE